MGDRKRRAAFVLELERLAEHGTDDEVLARLDEELSRAGCRSLYVGRPFIVLLRFYAGREDGFVPKRKLYVDEPVTDDLVCRARRFLEAKGIKR